MFIYWVLFLIPATAVFIPPGKFHRQLSSVGWLFTGLFFIVIIGFRWEVGTDWKTYHHVGLIFEKVWGDLEISELQSVPFGEFAYNLLYWIVIGKLDFGFVGVNLVGAVLFVVGLFAFCGKQPNRWLALAISVPFVVIVVSMGFNRQGVALGFELLGLVVLSRGNILGFMLCILTGALFHQSLILLLPLGVLASDS